MTQRNIVFNRPVFTTRVFDSSALAVLSTLIHRFPEPGEYELFIRRGNVVIHREPVRVVKEGATYQIDVDLANPERAKECCEKHAYVIKAGGVMTFFTTKGRSSYSVSVTRIGEKEKQILLDSREQVPQGDWYAVTLVQPGVYKVYVGDASGVITVLMPKPGGDYRTDQAVLVELGKEGLTSKELRIFAGQSVVFQLNVPARLHVELAKPDAVMMQTEKTGKFTARSPGAGESK